MLLEREPGHLLLGNSEGTESYLWSRWNLHVPQNTKFEKRSDDVFLFFFSFCGQNVLSRFSVCDNWRTSQAYTFCVKASKHLAIYFAQSCKKKPRCVYMFGHRHHP